MNLLPHGVCTSWEEVHAEGTYQAQMIVHGSQLVNDHALILTLLSTPAAEGAAALPM